MVRLFIVFIFFVLFFGLVFAGFKSPSFFGQPIIVESDKYFYGSTSGVVDIDLNLINVGGVEKDLFLNVTDLYVKGARVSNLKVNNASSELETGKLKSKNKIKVKKDVMTTVRISLTYDPRTLGIGKKFDIQLVNDSGVVVADLDPFLSGYTYRRQITVGNNSATAVPDTNTIVKLVLGANLGAKAQADCDDVRITYGEETEIDRNYYGNCQTDGNIFFPLSASIAGSGSSNNYYVYYGNAGATSPSAKDLVLPSPDSKGLVYCPLDDSLVNFSGGTNCTVSGTSYVTNSVAGNGAIKIDTRGDYVNTGFIPTGEAGLTVEAWFYFVSTAQQRMLGNRGNASLDLFEVLLESDGTLRAVLYIDNSVVYDLTSSTVPATNEYSHVAFTCGSAGAKLWYNGTPISSNASTVCPNMTGNYPIYFGMPNGEGSTDALIQNSYIDEIRISKVQKNKFPPSFVDTKAEQPSANLGAEGTDTIPVYSITWNVFRKDTSSDLTAVGVDSNVNAYDLSNQNSQFSQDLNRGHYAITFSRTGYDNNTNYFLNADSNKTLNIYLADTTAPSVGVTTLSGFSISGSYIKGTGSIFGGVASDTGSDVNISTCEYTVNNGGAWTSGDWNADTTKCQKMNYLISDLEAFRANTRIKDNAGNTGTGTLTSAYTGDVNAPSTTFAGCSAGTNATPQTITLTCNDNGVGCASTIYRIDAGTWTNYVAPFNINTSGNHVIDYNSRDSLNNIQAIQNADCNILIPNFAPVISIFYPNGGESFTKPTAVNVIFTIRDSDDNSVLIDLNYSISNIQGAGEPVLIDENTEGVALLCDDADFSNDTNCSYSWSTVGIADGNYYLLATATTDGNSSFDASDSNFQIKTSVVPPSPDIGEPPERYINPDDPIRDSNRYFEVGSEYLLTEDEKQTLLLEDNKNLIFWFGVLLLIGVFIMGFVLWKRN